MNPIRFLALSLAKSTGFLSRRLGLGGGTTFPGAVAQRLDPGLVPALCAPLSGGVTLVTGTNGKTTTARMLAQVLRRAGWQPIHNRAGANLVEGIATALIHASDLRGRPKGDSGLFEVDEAHLPRAVALCRPRLVLLHNLFRDQLDRYGEVDYVANRWIEALHTLPDSSTVALNADDPVVAELGPGLAAGVLYYGLDDPTLGSPDPDHTADARYCRRCGAPYRYDPVYYGHIGRYRCPNCGHSRPRLDIRLTDVTLEGDAGVRGRMVTPQGERELWIPLPGLYNAYNALAAVTAALALGVALDQILDTLAEFRAAFGRLERIQAQGRELFVALIKNPVGASQVLDMLTQEEGEKGYLVIINDRIADGTDVSWLWDADFERMAGGVRFAVASGTRAHDMAVRLKYAGVESDRIVTESDLGAALDAAISRTPPQQTLYLLPTYTAMLEVRALMARRGYVDPFWED